MSHDISRRNFVTGAATMAGVAAMASVATGALAEEASEHGEAVDPGSAGGFTAEGSDSMRNTPIETSWLTAPDPISDDQISETVDADVVVVGCGVAGLTAARAAAEQGVKTICIEKATSYQYRSGQYGIYNSTVQQENGITFDVKAAINDLMKEMGYRPDQRVWNLYAQYSGEAFDWFLAPTNGDYDFIPMDALTYDTSRITLQPTHFPAPEAYDVTKEYSPTYPEATLSFIPDQGGIMEVNYQAALEAGVEFRFSTWARQLVRPNNEGRVQGVICQDIDGNYIKVNAAKGVIMAAGDYGSNADMVKYYCGGRTYSAMWMNMDAAGNPTNIGEGQQMGMWIGAKMEDGPHAPMTHTLGGALGCDAFFLANTDGKRFCNEDVAGQQLSTQIYRQPGDIAIQIFDDNYPDQVGLMGCAHGSVNHIVDESENPHLEGYGMTIGRTSISSREEVEGNCIAIADTLEDLVAQLDLTDEARQNMLDSIARYNELCAKGVDEDFGKTSSRMFPIETPPFYATQIGAGAMLVCLGGLMIDPETLQVIDYDYQPIEGLYAAGNNMGGRILQDYPVTIGGVSHATALTFGYLSGKAAAGAWPTADGEVSAADSAAAEA